MNPLALALSLTAISSTTGTHPHVVQSAYEEERDRLLALFPDADDATRDECAAEALESVRKRLTERSAHLARVAMRPAP